MMDKGLLMEGLELSSVEAEAYLKILSSHGLRASAIARMVDVPRPKIYEILSRLIERGLIIEVKEGVARFYPVKPDLALDQIRSEARGEWEQRDTRVSPVTEGLTAIYTEGGPRTRGYDIVRIWSGEAVLTRKVGLMGGTRATFVGILTPPFLFHRGRGDIPLGFLRMVRRGVDARVLLHTDLLDAPGVRTFLSQVDESSQIRWSRDANQRLEVYDQKIALVVDPQISAEEFDQLRFQEFHQSAVVRIWSRRFDRLWQTAHPIPLPLPEDWERE